MKKLLLISMAFMLAACGVLQPVQQAQPTPIIATVLVTVVTTAIIPPASTPLPTLAPTQPPTEAPTQAQPTEVPPTAVPPTEAAAAQPTPTTQSNSAAPASSTGPVAIDPSFNGGSFKDITASTGMFYLRCAPKEIKFDVTTTDVYITTVELYFRLRDKHSTEVPGWSWAATLDSDGLYHFWTTISGESINPDLRKQQGWYDVEFVGLNKVGNAVGRTEKIIDVISYAIDCK